ncbi:thiol-disulfide oxidoreductase DCC family protein [Defluviimonas salinarum]|uniref:DCC1-like thiol-disulfide oxidoreductase family protein n=1 Tax=Defluviimonas salinarum TaxID=2992147 RepID=A0ABT3J2G5_9RHOB|nr:DCC1-like thiol-disulfide oxidoreductase family protein [Defluviimonas salinarum]MCW3781851.1 DCC1-like thiol-disulfide oxidoreductase family protein [Defluviimonas salinarum]
MRHDLADLIVFDATCVFCSGFARFMHRHDRAGRFRFVTAQSDLGRALYLRHGLDPVAMTTNIVIVDGRAHVKMRAFAAAMAALGRPWRWLALTRHLPGGDWIYDRIARNRYRIAGRRACAAPPPELRARLID